MSLEMTSSYVSLICPSLLRLSLIDLLTQILVLPLSIVSPSYDQYGTWGDTVSYPVGVVPSGTGRDNVSQFGVFPWALFLLRMERSLLMCREGLQLPLGGSLRGVGGLFGGSLPVYLLLWAGRSCLSLLGCLFFNLSCFIRCHL